MACRPIEGWLLYRLRLLWPCLDEGGESLAKSLARPRAGECPRGECPRGDLSGSRASSLANAGEACGSLGENALPKPVDAAVETGESLGEKVPPLGETAPPLGLLAGGPSSKGTVTIGHGSRPWKPLFQPSIGGTWSEPRALYEMSLSMLCFKHMNQKSLQNVMVH